MINRRS